jgi:hypothetical protein
MTENTPSPVGNVISIDDERWPLRAQPADEGWRGAAEGAEAAAVDLRDGDY